MQRAAWVLTGVLVAGRVAAADDAVVDPVRDPNATIAHIFHGPFDSSRLFSMPTADVLGAYMMSLSVDGSLLQQPGVLTSAGVLAIGFGDLAQVEYRHTGAISVTGVDAPLPAVGVQLTIPIPEYPLVPKLGIAVHVGVPRDELAGTATVTERVTDFYFVLRERVAPWLTLHGGLRVSPSKLNISGDAAQPDPDLSRTLVLPTSGFELRANPTTRVVGEVAAVPQFMWMANGAETPAIAYGLLARFGLRWRIVPSVVLDGSLGYQLANQNGVPGDGPRDVVQQWDIRLGAEVFVPWGALACRAVGAFCE
jgi:hypothetical protein